MKCSHFSMRSRLFLMPAIALAAASLHPAAFALSPAAARPALQGNPLLAQAATDLMGTVKYVMGNRGIALITPDGGGNEIRVDAKRGSRGVGWG